MGAGAANTNAMLLLKPVIRRPAARDGRSSYKVRTCTAGYKCALHHDHHHGKHGVIKLSKGITTVQARLPLRPVLCWPVVPPLAGEAPPGCGRKLGCRP